MNELIPFDVFAKVTSAAAQVRIPPFLFHYIIVFICVTFIVCVCVLKFKYLYWYSQPLTFRFTLRRFFGGGSGNGGGKQQTQIMNSLSLGERCYNAVVYPFLTHVNHKRVHVYQSSDGDIPFERIAALLSRRYTKILNYGAVCDETTIRLILSQDTFGLSAFIGVLYNDEEIRDNNDRVIKGVSILTPRIMVSFGSSSTTVPYRSVTVYMCEYLAWGKYTVSERESLELLETTEYIQKSREIAGEQTLYCYREIPWFVIPFSTVYSYTFSLQSVVGGGRKLRTLHIGNGITVVPVSSVNFALFYSFINEHTRDFRCCILNELTQLQSLVEHGLYRINMLILNDTNVIAAYIFTYSDFNGDSDDVMMQHNSKSFPQKTQVVKKKKTKGNRIADLHNYVSKTSTALVKYLPPVTSPKYDAFGKRITSASASKSASSREGRNSEDTHTNTKVLRLISSIQHKQMCNDTYFLKGFQCSSEYLAHTSGNGGVVIIDTLAHNYRLVDALILKPRTTNAAAYHLLSQSKWYYILYNAIIHEETLCKDILLV